ncbi:MAG TPA: tRNA lysidine(34) synthetase TilS [Nocardioidaceae bacterium]|nr:tRNA lysidine(34) synthetase TilS [Nocardioidaceae bacterium]
MVSTAGPDPAVAEVRSAVRDCLADVDPGAVVLVACSGGPDSMALAAAVVFESRRSGWLVGAVVVDHGLQPGSAEVASAVADHLRAMGCDPVEVVAVDATGADGPEGSARRARYAALAAAADRRGSSVVLLGHTLDDQAETVLLGLARGSGARSIAGMASIAGRYRRPLLALRRAQTRQACRAEQLEVWEDPHNQDRRFARVRIRLDVLPALEAAVGPGVAEALARTARQARWDADLLERLADDRYAELGGEAGLAVDRLATEPPAVRRRVLRAAALRAGAPPGELFDVHVGAVDNLVTAWHGQAGVDLPGRVRASRHGSYLTFRAAPPPAG